MADASQLFLLADHIKLSLLERQRAVTLGLEPNAQHAEILRSFDSLQHGIESLESQDAGSNKQQVIELRRQLEDLKSHFKGAGASQTLVEPNQSALTVDFSEARDIRPKPPADESSTIKTVRFSGGLPSTQQSAEESGLVPYRDDPDAAPDHGALDNQQIHEYHQQVLRDQDEQLDRLGESIGRQRDLSIQIGDELEDQVQILDDVDEYVSRHQTQLDRAKDRVGRIARKAKDNMQLTIIFILIIILILLIIILK